MQRKSTSTNRVSYKEPAEYGHTEWVTDETRVESGERVAAGKALEERALEPLAREEARRQRVRLRLGASASARAVLMGSSSSSGRRRVDEQRRQTLLRHERAEPRVSGGGARVHRQHAVHLEAFLGERACDKTRSHWCWRASR